MTRTSDYGMLGNKKILINIYFSFFFNLIIVHFRMGHCVRSWTDPFDNAIYSLATDYNWTIMSGSGVHSRVTLWDKRLSSHVLVIIIIIFFIYH